MAGAGGTFILRFDGYVHDIGNVNFLKRDSGWHDAGQIGGDHFFLRTSFVGGAVDPRAINFGSMR